MERQPVVSGNVHSVGYDSQRCILEVQFHNGSVYHYYAVPAHIHQGLMAAPSKGQYLHREVKSRYRYKKVS